MIVLHQTIKPKFGSDKRRSVFTWFRIIRVRKEVGQTRMNIETSASKSYWRQNNIYDGGIISLTDNFLKSYVTPLDLKIGMGEVQVI